MKRFLLVITGCVLGALNASAIDFTLDDGSFAMASAYDAYEGYDPEFVENQTVIPTLPGSGTVLAYANSAAALTDWITFNSPTLATLEMKSAIIIAHDPNSIDKSATSYAEFVFTLNELTDYSIAGDATWQHASMDTVFYGVQLLSGQTTIFDDMKDSGDEYGNFNSFTSGQLGAGVYTLMFSFSATGDPGEGFATLGNANFKLTLGSGSTTAVPESGMTFTLLAVALGLLATLATLRKRFQV